MVDGKGLCKMTINTVQYTKTQQVFNELAEAITLVWLICIYAVGAFTAVGVLFAFGNLALTIPSGLGYEFAWGHHVGPAHPAHLGGNYLCHHRGAGTPADHRADHGPRALRRRLPTPTRALAAQQARPVTTTMQQVDVRRRILNQVARGCFIDSSLNLVRDLYSDACLLHPGGTDNQSALIRAR
jgi:hypothetical protein